MKPVAQTHGQAGFSLMELMVALGITLVLAGAATSLMLATFRSTTATFELTEAQQSLRTAQEYMTRDLTIAGDGLKGINQIRIPTAFVQNYLTRTPVNDLEVPDYISLPVFTSDDELPADVVISGTAPAVTLLPGADRITMLAIDPDFESVDLPPDAINNNGNRINLPAGVDPTQFAVGEIYFIISQNRAAFGRITRIEESELRFANGNSYGLNASGVGGPIHTVSQNGTQPTTLVRMRMIQYFVNADGLLSRRTFGINNGGYADTVIAEHVTDLNFRYALNLRDANGNLRQPVASLTTPEEQVAVRQVEVDLTFETAHPVNNGRHATVQATTSVSVRNAQFKEAWQNVLPAPTP